MENERFENLDVIKIVAAFAICCHHYQQCFSVNYQVAALNGVLPLLGFLVELFFMISGFFAAKSIKKDKSLIQQYLGKWIRLYPYALITVIVTAIIMLFHYIMFGEGVWGNQYSFMGVVTSFLMLNQGWFIEFEPALNNPVWYICVLLCLYMFFYIIEYNLRKQGGKRLRGIVYLAIALIGGFGWHFGLSVPFFYISNCRGYATFFIGSLLYGLIESCYDNRKWRKRISSFSIVILIGAVVIILINRKFNWYLWVYIICPAIISVAVCIPQVNLKKTATLSEVTFQLYLWHVPCYYLFQFALDVRQIKFVHSGVSMCIATLVSFFVATVIYRYVELPIAKRMKKWRL